MLKADTMLVEPVHAVCRAQNNVLFQSRLKEHPPPYNIAALPAVPGVVKYSQRSATREINHNSVACVTIT